MFVYEYGVAIATLPSLSSFQAACITLSSTDRARATSEACLRDVVERLHQRWDSAFHRVAIVRRMWANHLTRNLDRSTWKAEVEQPPPGYVARLLTASDSQLHDVAGLHI
ncbi:unnamed protein product [Phytophthora fragariaefolia]|uniref:Unnamed protein product n=1 Tax=Phytophthora fragariaefolia TaxID=1490495 RepID=A0A9W6YCA5_9STRA|nr:unnamed protein product [Phytophthora fragariaefolia]